MKQNKANISLSYDIKDGRNFISVYYKIKCNCN